LEQCCYQVAPSTYRPNWGTSPRRFPQNSTGPTRDFQIVSLV